MLELMLVATLLAQPEPEPAIAVDETPAAGETVSLGTYLVSQVSRTEVANAITTVSVETNAPAPRAGSIPVRFFIDNTRGPRQTVKLTLTATSSRTNEVTRTVEVAAGANVTVNVPVDVGMHYGVAKAESSVIRPRDNVGASTYFQTTYDPQRVVLSLSRPEQFEKFVGKAPQYSAANVLVHAIPPAEAPTELASYTGYDLVVIPDPAIWAQLDPAARHAVEAFLVSGGYVLFGGAPASFDDLPRLTQMKQGAQAYGFGQLMLASTHSWQQLQPFRARLGVQPLGALPEYRRRYDHVTDDLLLPQATAPLGRFLLIIALFTLAIGPGSVWVARRRGPAALLFSIPLTAFATCVLIITYSLIADGFVVHSASYGLTLLDRKANRAVTHSVSAYYANLAPSKATYGSGVTLVAPWEDGRERYLTDMTWNEGLTLGGDFLPSRSYREWGFISVEPTRARLMLERKGSGWVLKNAMGFALEAVQVSIDGAMWGAESIREGGEAELTKGKGRRYDEKEIKVTRFGADVLTQFSAPLKHGEFYALTSGPGFAPTGGLSTQLYESRQWIRGEVEP